MGLNDFVSEALTQACQLSSCHQVKQTSQPASQSSCCPAYEESIQRQSPILFEVEDDVIKPILQFFFHDV